MAIIRVTTPTNRFRFPIDPANFEKIRITYAQKKEILFTKVKEDCIFDGYLVKVKLSQEETKMFNERWPVQIQVRGLTYSGSAVASKVFEREVGEVLDDGILES